ncbi:probable phytol kinase 1 chloroplastic [Phtheirospermum japonicum]|uniref:phytol kinase n=1 Tax=Phtheirospermum japonicum TaxID=374723 RepID=A0A830BU63_9LAMI|nr:probable phytol kinase 1 chloroplastic [Phtheirospermum japonicum]
MVYGATTKLILGAPASGTAFSSNFLSLRVLTPSFTLRLFPTILSPHIPAKYDGLRRPSTTVFSGAAEFGGAVLQDAGATALVVGGAYALVSTFDNLTRRKIIEQIGKIDLIDIEPETSPHTIRVAIFGILANLQISASTGARYFASLVPSINCLRLVINGLSLTADEGLIKSVSREGKPEELLRGPLFYVLVLILCAIVFWRESPVGMISLAMLCGGDGIADIMGRRFGSVKLPYNPQKSWAGSISMFLFGFLVSIGILYYFAVLGYIQLEWMQTLQRVALVSFVATLVESLPITGIVDDNISVPLVSKSTGKSNSKCKAFQHLLPPPLFPIAAGDQKAPNLMTY